MSGEHDPRRSVLAALAANSAIAVAKFVAGVISGSAALLAEALHSVADTGNQLLLLVGLSRAKRPADAQHPFGHGRERYVWTLLVGVNLFTLGAAFSVYNGIHGLMTDHEVPEPTIALIVIAFSALFEGAALRTGFKQFQSRRPPGRSLWQSVRESKDPEVLTVLAEDSAAITGLAVAALGITLAALTDIAAFDAAASIVIGLILGAVAFLLGRETYSLLLGETAAPEVNRRIREIVERSPSVGQIVTLQTLHAGPDEVVLVLEIVFRDELFTDDIERTIDKLEEAIRAELPQVRRIYVEPEAEPMSQPPDGERARPPRSGR